MPLKLGTGKTNYLNEYLMSEDVTDMIEWGKDQYPVEALCDNYRFVDAVNLIKKGYEILHEGHFSHEFLNIFYDITGGSRFLTSGQNSDEAKTELLNHLTDEYNKLSADEVYLIAEEMGFALYGGNSNYVKLVDPIRRLFPDVYEEFLHCDNMRDHFLPILLKCGDMTLAQDFVKYVYDGISHSTNMRETDADWDECDEWD